MMVWLYEWSRWPSVFRVARFPLCVSFRFAYVVMHLCLDRGEYSTAAMLSCLYGCVFFPVLAPMHRLRHTVLPFLSFVSPPPLPHAEPPLMVAR